MWSNREKSQLHHQLHQQQVLKEMKAQVKGLHVLDIYEVTENQDNLTLFCLFADCEPMNFEEAKEKKSWRSAMDEEIKSIQKK